ncbi:hypothetical protein L901_04810 [Agrobacterium sp. D14]|nr:hypothetical protein L901_04810 [Agrobacterium sp. D14]
MGDVCAMTLDQMAGNEEAAMAFERFVLRAHEGRLAAASDLQHLGNTVPERSHRCHGLVIGSSTRRAASQLVTQVQITDAHGVQPIAQLVLLEMRQSRARIGSNIEYDADVGGLDQRPEMFPRKIGMPHTENRVLQAVTSLCEVSLHVDFKNNTNKTNKTIG